MATISNDRHSIGVAVIVTVSCLWGRQNVVVAGGAAIQAALETGRLFKTLPLGPHLPGY